MSDSHYSPSLSEQEKIEKKDVRIGAIVICLGGLTFFIVGSIVASVFIFKGIEDYLKKNDTPVERMFEAKMEPPLPRLQVAPKQDLLDFQKEQQKTVSTYQVLDPAQGLAQIPVERAMAMMAENPARYAREEAKPEAAKTPAAQTPAPAEGAPAV